MSINIKPSHRGLFTSEAKAHGEGVQEFAQHQLHSSNPAERKRANFARMAKRHFKPIANHGEHGGKVFKE